MGDNTVSEDLLKKIDSKALEICKKKYPFERLVLSKDQALELFAANPFKVSYFFLFFPLAILSPISSFTPLFFFKG